MIAQDARNAGLKPNTVYKRKERDEPEEDWYKPVVNLRQQSKDAGLNYSTVKQRIALGWSIKKALSEPPIEPKYYTIGPRMYTIEELEKASGIKREIISHRINTLGWSVLRAASEQVRKRKMRE
jgi:hypothetical protein